MTASVGDIAHHFIYSGLWDLKGKGDSPPWDVDADTYINGCFVMVDADYYLGWGLEVVERETAVVSYVAVAMYHGVARDSDGDIISADFDYLMWDKDAGTFFERCVSNEEAALWAVAQIYSMFELKDEESRKRTRR